MGIWHDDVFSIGNIILNYFSDIFSSSVGDLSVLSHLVWPKVSVSQNAELLAPISESEVHSAVFAMHPDKSPRPDGYNPTFFQKFWSIVGVEVVLFCQEFMVSSSFPSDLNLTSIVLILKKDQVESMADLRPIALCNVLYKIVAKILANRLKPILPHIISEV